jgi:hypothetical protein
VTPDEGLERGLVLRLGEPGEEVGVCKYLTGFVAADGRE